MPDPLPLGDTARPDGPPARTPEAPFGLRFTLPLMLGTTLNPVNSSMIATGLAAIAADFHVGPGRSASLVAVLYLCSAVMQPTMGKLATLYGPRRIFLTGVAILLVGGVIGGLAPAFGLLLLSRALIGVGSSACYPSAMALVRRRAERLGTGVPSVVLGNFSIASQVVTVVGLPVGGVLAGVFGWRALFFVNVPLALIALGFAARQVEQDPPARRSRGLTGILADVDLAGIVLFAACVVSLLIFLDDLERPAWPLAGLAAATAAALVLWEHRAASPLIDVRALARSGALRRTYLRQMTTGLGVYTAMYAITQWLEGSAGYGSSRVGVIMLPLSLVSMVLARIVAKRGWVRRPLTLGALAMAGGGLTMAAARHDAGIWLPLAMTVLFGCTNGLSNFANQTTLYVQTPADGIAVASGLFRTFAYIGAIFSSSLIGIAFGDRVTDTGFHHLGWVVVGLGAFTALVTALDRRVPISVAGGPREQAPASQNPPASPHPTTEGTPVHLRILALLLTPLGLLLRRKRAGTEHSVRNAPELAAPRTFELTSPSFDHGGTIPLRHATMDLGPNLSPELRWAGLPEGTAQLLLVMEDIDVPMARPGVHLAALLPPDPAYVEEGALAPDNPRVRYLPDHRGRTGYHGPRPLPGHGVHRYGFHLFALDEVMPENATDADLQRLLPHVEGHILAGAFLEGILRG
ncbi:MFS transporter [Actinoallomurus rhizosphaericola]|uniref:MFS transporter n=1 Tax=Actinoallomurus rhizosphaericola TaxID=2952536 RepID=UPI002092D7E1|nr:MFS transporter [Actinoallomurus rhizosphaericola]MCO5999442.1 MFS transporter [Actinoallomurus rhizosphaericola]